MLDLSQRCTNGAGDGHLEMYRSTKKYDADEGLIPHGCPSLYGLPT